MSPNPNPHEPFTRQDLADMEIALQELARSRVKLARCKACGMYTKEAEEMVEELSAKLTQMRDTYFPPHTMLPEV